MFAWSGVYDIAATAPHWNVTLTFIGILRDRSIGAHSEDLRAPNLDDPKFEDAAFSHYHGICRLCHGAPGYEPEEFAKGLNPGAPSMTAGDIQQARSEAEVYWIVKNGIKMNGMAAFGPTHDDEQLRGLTALAKKMSPTTAEQYRQQVETAGLNGQKDQGHVHAPSESAKGHGHGHDEEAEHDEAQEDHH